MGSYSDGNFTQAAANGGKHKHFPFDGDNASCYTEQEFIQASANFNPLPLNTPDPAAAISFLVRETSPQDIGGGLVRWSRVHARIPAARDDYQSHAYTFPGYASLVSGGGQSPFGFVVFATPTITDPGRVPDTRKVVSRIRSEYFLTGPNGSYASPALIPVISAQRYVYGAAWGLLSGQDVQDRIIYQASLGDWSVPTVEAWKALVTAGTEIVAEDSEMERWMGNIYVRRTRYIKAQ